MNQSGQCLLFSIISIRHPIFLILPIFTRLWIQKVLSQLYRVTTDRRGASDSRNCYLWISLGSRFFFLDSDQPILIFFPRPSSKWSHSPPARQPFTNAIEACDTKDLSHPSLLTFTLYQLGTHSYHRGVRHQRSLASFAINILSSGLAPIHLLAK